MSGNISKNKFIFNLYTENYTLSNKYKENFQIDRNKGWTIWT